MYTTSEWNNRKTLHIKHLRGLQFWNETSKCLGWVTLWGGILFFSELKSVCENRGFIFNKYLRLQNNTERIILVCRFHLFLGFFICIHLVLCFLYWFESYIFINWINVNSFTVNTFTEWLVSFLNLFAHAITAMTTIYAHHKSPCVILQPDRVFGSGG